MSREKRARRAHHRQESNRKFVAIVLLVADAEGRPVVGIEEFDRYVQELFSRGVLVERGPQLSNGQHPLSFRFDLMRSGSRPITPHDLIAIFGNIDIQGRGAVA